MEVTFGLLAFIAAFVLLGWAMILLIKLQFKNEHRIIESNELERTSCFTLNSLLTRFLWIVLNVSILWLLQCIFTFKIRLWSNSIIDASNIQNKNNEHDITIIVLYFVFDLISLTLLLILYYILSEELSNLYDLNIMEQSRNENISHSVSDIHQNKIVSSQNPVTPSEKGISFYTPSQKRQRKQSRMERQRQELRMRQTKYERSNSNSPRSVMELKHNEDDDDNDIDLSVCSVDIFEEAIDSGMDCDNEDETETQFLPNYPPNINMIRNNDGIIHSKPL